jgi:ABC-type phosphate/phosphonate transport system permease subunit
VLSASNRYTPRVKVGSLAFETMKNANNTNNVMVRMIRFKYSLIFAKKNNINQLMTLSDKLAYLSLFLAVTYALPFDADQSGFSQDFD